MITAQFAMYQLRSAYLTPNFSEAVAAVESH